MLMGLTATKPTGMIMSARVKQVAAVGAAIASVGWMTVLSPGVVYAQPPRIPQGVSFTCPDVAGINYVQDPDDSNAYYLCVDGLTKSHDRCPGITYLIMSTPPHCQARSHPMGWNTARPGRGPRA
jgi:hypothetical protein